MKSSSPTNTKGLIHKKRAIEERIEQLQKTLDELNKKIPSVRRRVKGVGEAKGSNYWRREHRSHVEVRRATVEGLDKVAPTT